MRPHPCARRPRLCGNQCRRFAQRAIVLALLALVASPAAWASAPSAPAADALLPFTQFYGLYVNGQKVGWMRASLTLGRAPALGFVLSARVAGLGRSTEVQVQEERVFARLPGQKLGAARLRSIDFCQRSETGTVRVHGRRAGQGRAQGGNLLLVTEAGGARSSQSVAVTETLADDLALSLWVAAAPAPGQSVAVRHLDAAAQAMVQAEMVVEDVREVLLGGVNERIFRVKTRYPALKVEEMSQVDAHGKVMVTQVGGFFEARLETEQEAKKPGSEQDLLLGAVVKVPRPLAGVQGAEALELTLAGLPAGQEVPTTARQAVAAGSGNQLLLKLVRDAPADVPWQAPWRLTPQARTKAAQALPAEARHNLSPTPFIQSEAPEIVAMAKKHLGGARSVQEVLGRLGAAVQGHLHAEYVPAFSNALEAYHSRRGDCTEHSVLLAALARAAGLPARPVVGVAYWPPGNGFGWHAWVEVWADGRWLQTDPTWNQPIADVTHVKLADGSPTEQARVVMLLGQLRLLDWRLPPAAPPPLPTGRAAH